MSLDYSDICSLASQQKIITEQKLFLETYLVPVNHSASPISGCDWHPCEVHRGYKIGDYNIMSLIQSRSLHKASLVDGILTFTHHRSI